MTLRTNSATRRSVVSRSSVVLTTSATSSRRGSTPEGRGIGVAVICTVFIIAAKRGRAPRSPGAFSNSQSGRFCHPERSEGPGVRRNRHRGESHLSSPATPPYMRVRIRRFSSVELGRIQQPRKTERIEVSNRKCRLQGRAVGQTPGTMRTAGGLSREGRSDVPLAQFLKPHLATFPLLPDHGSQPASHPFF